MASFNIIKNYFKQTILKKIFYRKKISFFSYIDENSIVENNTSIGRDVKIINSYINEFSYIASGAKIVNATIGKFCSIAQDVKIGLGAHPINFVSTSPIFYSKLNALGIKWVDENRFQEFKKVIIENDVWIGANAIILDGVKIENGAIIGAGAIVTKDVPPYAIVVGSPAKIIKFRFPQETIDSLLRLNWWNWPIDKIKENINTFLNPADFINKFYS
jgi:acetyltransferase-like isoleucine patch superfamily enzyme